MRKQRPRGSTTRDAVVRAALAVVDQVGVERLTIRAVAHLVGAPPMSLYTHFSNKDGLLDLMYGEIAQRMYVYEQHDTWQSELLALAQRIRSLLSEHPNWTPLLSRPVPPLAVTLREQVLKLMTADGLSSTDALLGLSSVVLTAMGLVLLESTVRGSAEQSALTVRYSRLKEWVETPAADAHSETRTALSKVPSFELERVFQFAILALIAGLEARRAHE